MSAALGEADSVAASPLSPLADRQSLRELVADALRAALVSGEMRPGVVYSAPTLAAQFQVSATPVREAMLDLVKEGLVESVRNKGFRVTEVTERRLDEISEIRSLIEVPVIARLAPVITDDQVERLQQLADGICAAARAGDLIGYVEADRRFHLTLLGLNGNERLVKVIGELRAQTRLYGLSALVEEGRLLQSAQEHSELLDTLRAHDPGAAEELMRRHIGHVRGLWTPRGSD